MNILRKYSGKNKNSSRARAVVGGPLNSTNQLQDIYSNLLNRSDVVEGLKDEFQDVRIAVFGRSGSGKTTLIRLILGEKGPQTIAHGRCGVQDIHQEWHCSDPDIPLIIHDSNGMDVQGQERVDTIKSFLDERQNQPQFSQRIHLVWYIISAADSRILDDGGVIKLISSYNIPLLLVMTHHDWKEASEQNVTESILDDLLSEVVDKERVKAQMVRVSNRVRMTKNNELVDDEVSKQALQLVTKRTKELMGKKMRNTWAASQAVDMDEKLDASARIMVSFKKKAVFCSCVGIIPIAEQIKLSIMLVQILKAMCKIWRVPPSLEKALLRSVAMPEGSKSLIQNLLKNMVAVVGLAAAVAGTVLTAGVASPAILGVVATYSAMDSKHTTTLLMSFSCVILGSVLYIKSNQLTRDKWDADKSEEEYTTLCEEFATCRHSESFIFNVKRCHSTWDTLMEVKKHKNLIKSQIVLLFQDLLLNRPDSLFTLMNSDEKQPLLQDGWQDTLNMDHVVLLQNEITYPSSSDPWR